MAQVLAMNPWNDGHTHTWRYFGGMASCVQCAATLQPDGTVNAPTKSSRKHRQKGLL